MKLELGSKTRTRDEYYLVPLLLDDGSRRVNKGVHSFPLGFSSFQRYMWPMMENLYDYALYPVLMYGIFLAESN